MQLIKDLFSAIHYGTKQAWFWFRMKRAERKDAAKADVNDPVVDDFAGRVGLRRYQNEPDESLRQRIIMRSRGSA